jgi:hypothetical protein
VYCAGYSTNASTSAFTSSASANSPVQYLRSISPIYARSSGCHCLRIIIHATSGSNPLLYESPAKHLLLIHIPHIHTGGDQSAWPAWMDTRTDETTQH